MLIVVDPASKREDLSVLAFAFSFSVLKIADSTSSAIFSLLSFLAARALGSGDLPLIVQQWMVSCRTLAMFAIGAGLLWLSRSYWRDTVQFGRQRLPQYAWLLAMPIIQVAWAVLLVGVTAPEVTIGGGFRFQWDPRIIAFGSSVLAAPIIEEILFRGVLFSKLVESGWTAGRVVTATSLIWALGHLPNDLGALKFFIVLPLGFALGLIRAKTKGVFLALAVHMAVNLTVAILPALPPEEMAKVWFLNLAGRATTVNGSGMSQ